MKKMVAIPMRDLTDLKEWHLAQAARHDRLKEQHAKRYGLTSKYGATIMRADQTKADFHRSAARVVEAAIMSELHVQAALL
jgi:hypothetical protein